MWTASSALLCHSRRLLHSNSSSFFRSESPRVRPGGRCSWYLAELGRTRPGVNGPRLLFTMFLSPVARFPKVSLRGMRRASNKSGLQRQAWDGGRRKTMSGYRTVRSAACPPLFSRPGLSILSVCLRRCPRVRSVRSAAPATLGYVHVFRVGPHEAAFHAVAVPRRCPKLSSARRMSEHCW